MGKIKLSVLQSNFLFNIARLIIYAHALGYNVTLGRGLVTPEENKKQGGIKKSLHLIAMAQDLNFFKGGKYLTRTEDLAIFGKWWKAQGDVCTWGGDFKPPTKPDGNHFSHIYEGVK